MKNLNERKFENFLVFLGGLLAVLGVALNVTALIFTSIALFVFLIFVENNSINE